MPDEPKHNPVSFDKTVPFLFDRTDLPVRVTLYPTGHVALGVQEYLEKLGRDDIPVDLQVSIQEYLGTRWRGKQITSADADTISTDIKDRIDKWVAVAAKKAKRMRKLP